MQTLSQRRVLSAALNTAKIREEEIAMSTSAELVKRVVATIDTGKTQSLTNPINWPVSATFAVSYSLHDRQFPQVEHSETVVYFDNVSQLLQWLEEKREWIKGTDYDFSMDYAVYVWDWGPVFKYTKSM